MKRGGKYLGEGTYGCVLAPSPPCVQKHFIDGDTHTPRSQRHTPTVGKVFTSSEDLVDEWEQARVIAKIDPRMNYFIYPTTRCEAKRSDILRDADAKECEVVKYSTAITMPMLQMPRWGVTLKEALMARKGAQRMSVKEFIRPLIPVFEGCVKLARAGLVHHDLKFNNILYDEGRRECRVIDFGLIVRAKYVFDEDNNEFLHSAFWLHPPEYRLASLIARGGTVDPARILQDNDRILNLSYDHGARMVNFNRRIYDLWGGRTVFEQMEQGFIQAVMTHKKKDNALAFMTKAAALRVDIWCLGISLIHLSQFVANARPALQGLLQGMLHPDPRKRLSPTAALKMAKAIAA